MLDTATKRRSMIAIPGIGTLPVADMNIDAADRRHIIDVFGAFGSVIETFFFWRKRSLVTPTWVPDVDPANPFVASQHGSETWVPDRDLPEE